MIEQTGGLNLLSTLRLFEGKTVALVGNSACIMDRQDGKEIDSHDIVIRMNDGFDPEPTLGWGKALGSVGQCQGDVWAGHIAKGMKQTPHVVEGVRPRKSVPLCDFETPAQVANILVSFKREMWAHPNICHNTWIQPKEILSELSRECFGGARPSTGACILNLLRRLAVRHEIMPAAVSLYGFDHLRRVSWPYEPPERWGETKDLRFGKHDPDLEQVFTVGLMGPQVAEGVYRWRHMTWHAASDLLDPRIARIAAEEEKQDEGESRNLTCPQCGEDKWKPKVCDQDTCAVCGYVWADVVRALEEKQDEGQDERGRSEIWNTPPEHVGSGGSTVPDDPGGHSGATPVVPERESKGVEPSPDSELERKRAEASDRGLLSRWLGTRPAHREEEPQRLDPNHDEGEGEVREGTPADEGRD